MKRTIAFVTCSTKPAIAPDDVGVAELLRQNGIEVSGVPWDGPTQDWASFDLVILRSCWNYHLHPEAFSEWLRTLEICGANVWNPTNIIQWNVHKGYLEQLSQQGVAMADTVWVPKGGIIQLPQVLTERNWKKAVIKPAISATAFRTMVADAKNAEEVQHELNDLLTQRDVLVQEFRPEVTELGEWSLLFFDKTYSHAVIKKPKTNDFRVQNDFGGTAESSVPPHLVIEQASAILERIAEPLLYTRIDGLLAKDRFLLMEFELIEPVLFLQHHPEATTRFCQSIMKKLK